MNRGVQAMGYSIRQAAEVCGKSRTTLHRALKDGRMSGTQDEATGEWSIDPSELRRVFPWTGGVHEHKSTDMQGPYIPPQIDEVMAVKVAMLEDQLGRERETVADLRKRLDRAEDRLTLLTDQRGLGIVAGAGKSWLARMLGR